MSYSRREASVPESPVLVVAMEGWIDAGFVAQTSVGSLLEQFQTEALATFDADDLIDQRARRPRLRVTDGVRGEPSYPTPELRVGRDEHGRGFALLVGPEPDYRWRPFAREVSALAGELSSPLVVGLGAFPSPVPHTRPVALTTTASTTELASRIGFLHGSIDAPAGIADVIGSYCSESGIPSIGLWAAVPHYVAGMAYTPACVALIEGLCSLSGLSIDLSELRESARRCQERVTELIAQSDEHQDMVRRLEEQYEADDEDEDETPAEAIGEADLANSDKLMEELERYLREQS